MPQVSYVKGGCVPGLPMLKDRRWSSLMGSERVRPPWRCLCVRWSNAVRTADEQLTRNQLETMVSQLFRRHYDQGRSLVMDTIIQNQMSHSSKVFKQMVRREERLGNLCGFCDILDAQLRLCPPSAEPTYETVILGRTIRAIQTEYNNMAKKCTKMFADKTVFMRIYNSVRLTHSEADVRASIALGISDDELIWGQGGRGRNNGGKGNTGGGGYRGTRTSGNRYKPASHQYTHAEVKAPVNQRPPPFMFGRRNVLVKAGVTGGWCRDYFAHGGCRYMNKQPDGCLHGHWISVEDSQQTRFSPPWMQRGGHGGGMGRGRGRGRGGFGGNFGGGFQRQVQQILHPQQQGGGPAFNQQPRGGNMHPQRAAIQAAPERGRGGGRFGVIHLNAPNVSHMSLIAVRT